MGTIRSMTIIMILATTVGYTADLEVCATCPYTTIASGIAAANSGDTIRLTDATYYESGLVVDKNLTITGNGVDATTIDSDYNDHTFFVPSGVTAMIFEMTLVEGGAFSPGSARGGIAVEGALLMDHVDMVDSVTHVIMRPGSVGQVTNCNFSMGPLGFMPSSFIVEVGGYADIRASTFTGGDTSFGGALLNNGTVDISRSTFYDNRAHWGGAIYNNGTMGILNSTITGNEAGFDGGGIRSVSGSLSLGHVTVADNWANRWDGGVSGTGITAANCIVGNNTTGLGQYEDCSPGITPVAGTVNLTTHNSCDTFTLVSDLMLEPLADNGGITPTMALLPGSPAINAAPCQAYGTRDQRRVPRNQDALGCDVGAFEYVAPTNYGLNSEGNVFLQNGAIVDSYDGCAGPYGGANVGSEGNIRAGGTVTLGSNTSVGIVVENDPPGETPRTEPFGSSGNLNINGLVELPAGDYVCNNLTVFGNSTLRGIGGEVRIWVLNNLVIQSNGKVEAHDGYAGNMVFVCPPGNDQVVLQSGSITTAVIHAPSRRITAQSNCDFFGKLYGDYIELQNNARIHYDTSLDSVCN